MMLAGRENELTRILLELESVRSSGTAGSVLVRGAGGIGKSRLVASFVEDCERQGLHAISGRADSFDHGIPLGIIRDALGGLNPKELSAALHTQLEELGRALDIRRLAGADHLRSTEPAPQLDQVANLLTRLLADLAADGVALLVLDDLHLADPESVSLFRVLARNLADTPVLFILTARPGYPVLSELEMYVERMADRERAVIIDLHPLGSEAVSLLVAATLNHPPSAELTAYIMQQSAGNPFFARELSLQLLSDQRVSVRNGRAKLDSGTSAGPVHRAHPLTARFFSASSDEGRTAAALSIFGRFQHSQVPLVAELTGLAANRVEWCCERLVQNQLLVRGASGYEFAHPLLKSSLYNGLGDAQRAVMHGIVAEHLMAEHLMAEHSMAEHLMAGQSQVRTEPSSLNVFELATHVAASAIPGDNKALEILLTAARLAMQDAPLVAAGWFESALELLPRSDPSRPLIQSEHTYAYVIAAHSEKASITGLEALSESTPGSDLAPLIFATVSAMYPNGQLEDALELIDAHLPEHSGELSILALRMSMLAQLGRIHEAALLYRRAQQLPLPVDPIAAMTTCVHLLLFAQLSGRQPEGLQIERRIRELLPSVPPAVRAEFLNLISLIPIHHTGAIDVAEADLDQAKALRGGITSASAGGNAEDAAMMIGWYRGHWDEAMSNVLDTIDLLKDKGNHLVLASICGYATLILTDRGEHQLAAEMLGPEILGPSAWGPLAAKALLTVATARSERHLGSPHIAASTLRNYCEQALKTGSYVYYSLAAEEWAITEWAIGNKDQARAIAAGSLSFVRPALSPFLDLCALRSWGATSGDNDAGREALAIAEREKLPVEIAKCLLALNESEKAQIPELLRAHEIFASVRAVPWIRRTSSALRRLGRAAPRRSSSADLSPTEWELISLVVQGLTNRQIAGALKYSTKTVEVYLSRLYAKTGYQSRVDLARAAIQGDLVREAHG